MNQAGRYPVKQLDRSYLIVRRTLDIVLGSLLLLLSLPIILIAAVAIRLETEGSPFFFQKRIGLGGKPFRIFKLRGMYIDSRTRFAELYDYGKHGTLNFHFHPKSDPRITRVGAFIRRTSIDELPNFFNVVLGQMTLVGPRPEVPEMMALYGDYAPAYLSIKPGVTCISKISGRDNLSKVESIEMDLGYLEHMGIAHDCSILWKTLRGVLLREDVYDGKAADASIETHLVLRNKVTSINQKQTEAGTP